MKNLVWGLLLTIMVPCLADARIGDVVQLTGDNAKMSRSSADLSLKKNSTIESNDLIIVGSNTNTEIKFIDNTNVKITANSRLLIDDFVYDARRSDAGKIGLKVALGTVRYASGQIAKTHRQGVNIKTPTATIAVRGTDFAMTVDESGKSMVVLLPSCTTEEDLKKFEFIGNCATGQIDVMTAVGSVTLNQPYTATYVVDSNTTPIPPVQLPMDLSIVSNDSILSLPDVIADAQERRNGKRNKDDEDEENAQRENSNFKKQSETETTIIASKEETKEIDESLESNCYPFTECGNTQGRNYYYKFDEEKGNVISIRTGELFDNVTYNISVNSNDISTRTVGDGSTVITVRQWNR